ncbi:type I phosphomannose isomerase catalytic subunit [Pontibacter sp. G13]|uniref:type I phosphomannose isomerase catalytic subunit n=1 Tax=Pontibacter sp. G13 TaxID=3074898 RepID=UPI00288991C4|nr:type I phosphomannose isomerase catalytic subunit [Pontibacter sp. G13]WNJ18707.1 type I phosphomannose isomerase catalytic subunit [Pontibacter sp. G13]
MLQTVTLYPLRFETIFKEKLWGGQKIKTMLNKDFGTLANCGETWEISGVDGNISVVREGNLAGKTLVELIQEFKGDLLGKQVYERFGEEFPLLVKFIDANDDLSIQVHPDDELAKERHDSFGKTEMWYIFQADEGSKLIAGFNQPVDKASYQQHFEEGKLMDILNQEAVNADDVYFLPAGRVHTIGKGLLLAEIQQTSDITYRIYDFDRRDSEGNLRELHVEQALDAIDYNHYPEYKTAYDHAPEQGVNLVSCPYFVTNRLNFSEPSTRDYSALDSFVIYVCVEGSLTLKFEEGSVEIAKGDAYLLPATIDSVELIPHESYKMLEAWVPAPTDE